MTRIHCVGVLVVDALSGPLEHYPVPKQCTQVVTDSVRFLPGGGAANTGAALARMGIATGVFAKVGDDMSGRFLVQELAHSGVDTTGIVVSATDTTPFTFVGIHPDGDRTFIHTPGANLTYAWEDLDLPSLLSADIVLYQDLWVKPALDGAPAAELLAAARRQGVVTALDECWGLGPDRASLERLVPLCDFVLPSLDDLQAVYPGLGAEALADRLLAQGAGAAVIKQGARGCLVAHGTDRTVVPALPASVVDTTGAGDCWDAGFLAGVARGENLVTAARIGNACAAFCIEAVGGAAGVPDYARVLARAGEAPART